MAMANDLPSRRRLYLLRHGDVSYFDEQGRPYQPNTVPLNEAGRAQADAAGQILQTIPFDRVLTSDLPRTIETAQRILALRSAAENTLTVEPVTQLREIQPGKLSGIEPERQRDYFLNALGRSLTRESLFLGGESLGTFLDRVLPFLAALVADSSWRHLLIVAHGGVNRAILTHALGVGLAGFSVLEQDPCCINILDLDEAGHWLVRLVNHTPYDASKEGLRLTTMERIYLDFLRGSPSR